MIEQIAWMRGRLASEEGCHAQDPLLSEYNHFDTALKDAANLLEATHKAWWDATCDLDEPRSKAPAKQ
jgi:hypothetical protein